MKNSATKKACAVLSVLLGASVWAAVYRDRDEVNRSFSLPAKGRVEVFAISGSIDIKAIDGDTAIVDIERTARRRGELECNKVVLEEASGSLSIQSKTANGNGCEKIRV